LQQTVATNSCNKQLQQTVATKTVATTSCNMIRMYRHDSDVGDN